MNTLFRHHLPNTSIIFTVCLLSICVLNLLTAGPDHGLDTVFIIELFFFFTATQYLYDLIGLFPFKRNMSFTLTHFLITYASCFIAAYVFHWFSFTPPMLLQESILFTVVYLLLELYLTKLHQKRADEINKLLAARLTE